MSVRKIEEEYYIKPVGDPKLIGWYAWPVPSWGPYFAQRRRLGKYHAFLLNNPKNYKHPDDDHITVWDACGRNGIPEDADFEENPPIENRCKNCLKELKKLGITV